MQNCEVLKKQTKRCYLINYQSFIYIFNMKLNMKINMKIKSKTTKYKNQ